MKSKRPVDFMAGLRVIAGREGVQRHPGPVAKAAAEPTPPEEAPSEEAPSDGPAPQRSRRGKVAIAQWVDPAVRKQLAQRALDHDKSQAVLGAEALNLLFEKYGKSPIATA